MSQVCVVGSSLSKSGDLCGIIMGSVLGGNTNEEEINMVIGICDDDKVIRKQIKHICEQVLNAKCMDNRIIEFTNGREVIDNEEKLGLLILDIEMPILDGIRVKENFQQMGEETLYI